MEATTNGKPSGMTSSNVSVPIQTRPGFVPIHRQGSLGGMGIKTTIVSKNQENAPINFATGPPEAILPTGNILRSSYPSAPVHSAQLAMDHPTFPLKLSERPVEAEHSRPVAAKETSSSRGRYSSTQAGSYPPRTGKWAESEDSALKEAVGLLGTSDWVLIAPMVRGRTPEQCRERWVSFLAHGLNNSDLTAEEIRLMKKLLPTYVQNRKKPWAKLAQQFPGRTGSILKNAWKRYETSLKPKRSMSKSQVVPGTLSRSSSFSDSGIFDSSISAVQTPSSSDWLDMTPPTPSPPPSLASSSSSTCSLPSFEPTIKSGFEILQMQGHHAVAVSVVPKPLPKPSTSASMSSFQRIPLTPSLQLTQATPTILTERVHMQVTLHEEVAQPQSETRQRPALQSVPQHRSSYQLLASHDELHQMPTLPQHMQYHSVQYPTSQVPEIDHLPQVFHMQDEDVPSTPPKSRPSQQPLRQPQQQLAPMQGPGPQRQIPQPTFATPRPKAQNNAPFTPLSKNHTVVSWRSPSGTPARGLLDSSTVHTSSPVGAPRGALGLLSPGGWNKMDQSLFSESNGCIVDASTHRLSIGGDFSTHGFALFGAGADLHSSVAAHDTNASTDLSPESNTNVNWSFSEPSPWRI